MTMDLKTIILYLCVCTVCCYPSRPLNDRPNELAWQAWLLVDSQNNNHGETDRRITPKSVFIAPNLGDNGSLPDCAEGYRSDPMGRCIKFVKVDQAAHLDFLLQRLNEMYATNPSEEVDDEVKPTTGPLQVNIPLGGGFPLGDQDPEPEIIIVAPTNGNFESDEEDEDKTEVKRRHQNKEKEMTTTVTRTTVEDETTIPSTEATTIPSTMPTTQKLEAPRSTVAPAAIPASADDLQALFFRVPMNKTNHVQNNRTSDDTQQSDTPIESSKTTSDVKTVTELLPMDTDTERTESTDTDSTYNSTPVDGDMEPQADKVKGKPDLETTFSVEDATDAFRLGFVRFPNDRDTTTPE